MQVQIRPGDTLWALARRYGTSPSQLMQANPQIRNANLIYAGQMLNVPGKKDDFVPAKAKGGEPQATGATQSARGTAPASFREGAWGGQCLAWVNKTSGRPMWNFCAKNCLTNHPGWTRVSQPQPGDLFVMANGIYGHIGYVLGVISNGTITVADSNWNLDEREHIHTIPMSSIAGYLR